MLPRQYRTIPVLHVSILVLNTVPICPVSQFSVYRYTGIGCPSSGTHVTRLSLQLCMVLPMKYVRCPSVLKPQMLAGDVMGEGERNKAVEEEEDLRHWLWFLFVFNRIDYGRRIVQSMIAIHRQIVLEFCLVKISKLLSEVRVIVKDLQTVLCNLYFKLASMLKKSQLYNIKYEPSKGGGGANVAPLGFSGITQWPDRIFWCALEYS